MKFIEIAHRVIEQRKYEPIEERLCPDQYVGKINEFTTNSSSDFPKRKAVEERPEVTKCLIIILESPHKEEFKNSPAPAKGATGKLIRSYILNVKGLSIYKDYGLVLMNAIQNQCSLGRSTKCYRDEVFISVWNNGGKEDFIERLNKIHRQNDVIVNCCTKGVIAQNELRRLVQYSMPNNIGTVLRRTHPSSWYSVKNRESEWKIT